MSRQHDVRAQEYDKLKLENDLSEAELKRMEFDSCCPRACCDALMRMHTRILPVIIDHC